jgi:hypothetical protein
MFILILDIVAAEAANSPLDIECRPTEKDTKWDELLAPAPMGIAVLSQLMICTSHVADFPIDKIKRDEISLLKHPSSFRTTLVQIVNEAYNAFMKAHINMERIKLQVSQVPDYVKDCVKIIKSDNKVAIEKFVPRRLECIKNAADNGEKLSKEVAQAFDSLGQLIQQVLLAIAASQGAKEQEIQDAIKANIAEKKKRQEQELERQKKYLQKEEDDNQKLKNKGEDFVLEERKRYRDALELIFFSGEKKKNLEKIQTMIQDALKRLEETKEKAKKAEEEMGEIENEYIKSLENMHIDVKKDISTDQMIQILKDGTQQLGKLQENWTGMTLYFQSINSYIEDMKTKQKMFVEDAEGAQDSSLIDFMAVSIKKSLESSIKSHRTAAMYVQVSNNYIIEPLQVMHGMLAIEPAKMEQAQKELIESCKKASKGIKDMFNEDSAQTIREIENALQSSDPVQSIEN